MTTNSDLTRLDASLEGVAAGTVIPYLGPGVAALGTGSFPAAPQALCERIEAEIRVPKRAHGNLWSAAQYVESRKFRATLDDIVQRAFDGASGVNPIARWVAAQRPPLVVDAWYDSALLDAYRSGGAGTWGWVQGVSRNGEWTLIWTKAYAADGTERLEGADPDWTSLVYKPHGLARKGSSFLMSDSDYVEVLTEIDIQSPIPDEVIRRRTGRGFLYLGCRFDDQMLRTFARQISKRSGGPQVAVIEGSLSRMEARFLSENGITRIDLPLAEVAKRLDAVPA